MVSRVILVLELRSIASKRKDGDFLFNFKNMNRKISAIKRIEEMAGKLDGVISLAQGIPSFPSHEIIRREVIKAVERNLVDKYSPVAGLPELRSLVSERILKRGMRYSWEKEIIITAGAIEALSASIFALLKEGEEIIVFTPTYSYYSRIGKIRGLKIVSVPLDEENGWDISIESFNNSINEKTRGVVICNPNNPTGSVMGRDRLMQIAEIAERNNMLIFLDDVYEDLYYEEGELFNLCSLERFKERIIRIVSFSKSLALSGWRIGFLHGPERLIEEILYVHDVLVNCAPVISQYAAITGLRNEAIISSYHKDYLKRRAIMEIYLIDLKEYLSFVRPIGSYYFFPRMKGVDNTEDFCMDMLKKTRVAMVPGSDFGQGGEGHIRICFGRSEDDIHEGMKRFGEYLKQKNA